MNFVTWSIRNPVPVIVLFIALTVAGLISFPKLGVLDRPDIEFPAVVVTVTYRRRRADADGVRDHAQGRGRRRDDRRHRADDVDRRRGRVDDEHRVPLRHRPLAALDDVRDAMTRIRSDLPADANEPIVSRVTTAGGAIVTWSVASDNMTDTELSWFVDLTVTRELSAVPGIGRVSRVGGVAREIRVDLDPDRMAALGATASDVSRQLRRIQAEYPGGEGRLGGLEQTVRTTGIITSVYDLRALPISLPDGRSVRLDTIAEVRDQAGEQRSAALLDGEPVIGFQIVRTWGASALDVAKDARAVVERLQQEYPHVKFAEASSTVGYIQESFDASIEMLIEGAILAIIVVWLFLRDWRATAVSAVALPLSIIPTFWAIWALGYTLNILTLLALSLVVGILVDDAIVEVENIVRHLRMGKKPKEAAMDAAIEIGLAVVATTLTIVAVFVPVAFMSGIAGEFFGPFSFTVVVAVLCSLLVARTLTPMMAAYFLKPHDRPEQPVARHDVVPRARALVPGASLDDARRRQRRHRLDARPVSILVDGFLAGRRQRLHDAERGARARRVARGYARGRRNRAQALGRVARGAQRLHDGRRAGRRQRLRRRRLGGQRAPRLARDPARQSRRHARGTADLRAQSHRDAARHSRRAVPVRRRWRRQPAPGHAGRRRAEPPEPRGGERRARDPRDAGPRHDHEQRRAAEARDRHSAAARARRGARRDDGDIESRHAHRHQRRRQHEPREVQPGQPPDPDPRSAQRYVAQRSRAAAAPVGAGHATAPCR